MNGRLLVGNCMTIRIRNKTTGEIKEIEENELQNYGLSKPTAQPKTIQPQLQPQQEQSFYGKVGGGALNLLKSIGLMASGLPRAALTAGSELAQTPTRLIVQNRLEKLLQQPTTAKNIKERERLAGILGDIAKTPLLTQEERQALSGGMGEAMVKGSKMGAGTGAFMVPGAGAMPGLLSGALGGYAASGRGLEESVGGTLVGGVTGGITGALLSKLFPTGKKISRTGQELRRGVIEPKVPTGPMSLRKEQAMVQALDDLGLKGSPKAMRSQMADVFENLSKQADDILSRSKASSSTDDIINSIKTNISEQGDYWIPDDVTFQRYLDRELKLLEKKSVGGTLSAKSIFEFKTNLGKKLKNAFNKEKGFSTSAPSMLEGARLDIWRSIDDILTGMEPAVKDATLKQSTLYELAPGIEKAAKEKLAKIPFTEIGISKQPLQAMQDIAGRRLTGIGRALEPVLGAVKQPVTRAATVTAPSMVQQLTGTREALQEPVPTIQKRDGQVSDIPTADDYMSSYENYVNAAPRIDKQKAAMAMLMLPKADADKLANFIKMTEGSVEEQKISRSKEATEQIITQLEELYLGGRLFSGGKGVGARISGKAREISAKLGYEPDIMVYMSMVDSVRPTLARAAGDVGNLSEAEQIAAVGALPQSPTATKEEAIKGFQEMRRKFGLKKVNYSKLYGL